MPDKSKYNLDFRPENYFDVRDAKSEIFSRIKGQERRLLAKEMDQTGEIENLEQLNVADIEGKKEEIVFIEELTDEQRDFAGKLHPKMMGGEYLPTLRGYEMEIARVVLESTTEDVYSVRARPNGEKIRYNIASEYEDDEDFPEISFQPQESLLPLTMGELNGLIDSIRFEGADDGGERFTNALRNRQLVSEDELKALEPEMVKMIFPEGVEAGTNPANLISFVTVTSELYPELEAYYREEAIVWLERVKAKRKSS